MTIGVDLFETRGCVAVVVLLLILLVSSVLFVLVLFLLRDKKEVK